MIQYDFSGNALHLSTLLFNIFKAALRRWQKSRKNPTWVFWTADRDVTIYF